MLRLLEVKGALVTIDALRCQKDIADTIIEQEADYVLAVKDNQPTLAEDVKLAFKQAPAELLRSTETTDEGHGRVEIRGYCQCHDLSALRTQSEWRGLKSLCRVVSYRFTSDGEKSVETRYYISSVGPGVKRLAGAIRAHWGIENQLHYILDMSFDEDHNRIRKGDGAEYMTVIRHIAMNYLSQAKYLKVGIKNRRNLAAINTDVLQRILDMRLVMTKNMLRFLARPMATTATA